MKLELKHLAPYLPYKLMVRYKPHFSDDFKIKELDVNAIAFSLQQQDKPILRPLSDLTKEIEVNGEKFVPIEWFENDSIVDYFDGNIWVKFLFEDGRGDLSLIPFGMIQKLLEWHFDIYGLIENILAIDINTLEK
jgi:hypothetical protein